MESEGNYLLSFHFIVQKSFQQNKQLRAINTEKKKTFIAQKYRFKLQIAVIGNAESAI